MWAADILPVFISDKGKGRAVGHQPGSGAFTGKTKATSPRNKRAGGTADMGSWQNGVCVSATQLLVFLFSFGLLCFV